ncbi:microtubule-actin cross-linking factor 1, isoforms 6/7-like [Porphyrio hochstetteri]
MSRSPRRPSSSTARVGTFLGRLSVAEQTLRCGGFPEEERALRQCQGQLQELLEALQGQELELGHITALGEEILAACHPDSVITIKSWVTVAKSRFQECCHGAMATVPSWCLCGASVVPWRCHGVGATVAVPWWCRGGAVAVPRCRCHPSATVLVPWWCHGVGAAVSVPRQLVPCRRCAAGRSSRPSGCGHRQPARRSAREELARVGDWVAAAEEALGLREREPLPEEPEALEQLSAQHAVFMEELSRKQPDVERVTQSCKRKLGPELGPPAARRLATRPEPPGRALTPCPQGAAARGRRRARRRCRRGGWSPRPPSRPSSCTAGSSSGSWRWTGSTRLETALRRLRELEELARFDFGLWRRRYVLWIGQMKARVLDVFRGIDRDQDGRISQREFIQGVLASKFPTNALEMAAVASIFDTNGDGFIDYYEFVSALHPSRDPLRRAADADRIQDEVNRQVAQCNCAKRFQVEQISANRYRFGESQQLRMVRILRSTLMVRVGGGWIALDEFLVKNDPCRVKGRTNLKINEKYLSPEAFGAAKGAGNQSAPPSKALSPSRSSSSLSLYSSASGPQQPPGQEGGAAADALRGPVPALPGVPASRRSRAAVLRRGVPGRGTPG